MNYAALVQQTTALYLGFYVVYLAAKIGGETLLMDLPLLPGALYTFIYAHNTINIQVAHVTK